jgi:PAS domain S-box-containing protein
MRRIRLQFKSVKQRFVFSLFPVILIISLVLLSLFLYRANNLIEQALSDLGFALVRSLSSSSEIAVASEDEVFLRPHLEGILGEADVVVVATYNKNGSIIASRAKVEIEPGMPHGVREELVTGGGVVTRDSLSVDGEQVMDFYYPIWASDVLSPQRSGSTRQLIGFARVGLSAQPLVDEYQRTLIVGLGITALVTLVGFGISYLLASSVVRPISELKKGAEAIGRGFFGHQIQLKGIDEIGALAAAFNKMAYELQRTTFSKDYVESILGAMSDLLIVVNPDWTIKSVNRATEDLLGYQGEQLLGRHLGTLFSEAHDKPPTGKGLDRLIEKGLAKAIEGTFLSMDGSLIPVLLSVSLLRDSNGSSQGIVCVARDISQLKCARDALNAEKEQLAVTLRSIGEGVITTDIEGKVVLANRVAEELTGWMEQQAIGRSLDEVLRISDIQTRSARTGLVQEIISLGKVVSLADHALMNRKDGTERLVTASGAPICNKDGDVVGSVVVCQDVTERRRMEEDLLRANKIESLGVLAGGIAHDFNNILVGILGNISIAKIYLGPDHKAFAKLDRAESASSRAQALTHQLLTFSKGGAPVKTTGSLKELVEESAQFVIHGSRSRCEISSVPDLWPARFDAGQMSQVINNLLINAVQAMSEGGVIRVRLENVTVGEGHIPPLTAGRYVEIMVSDEGSGIPHDHIQNIFDPFFSTKTGGSGLGLATAYSVTKNHGGTIKVFSKPGERTTFRIYLPSSDEQILTAADSQAIRLGGGSGKVLVVDDEEGVREVAAGMLSHLGCEVAKAASVDEGIKCFEKARAEGRPFTAIILDLTMPGDMPGHKAIKEFLRVDPDAKVIVSSGYSNDPVMSNFREYGFSGVLAKPYMLQQLSDTLHRVMQT